MLALHNVTYFERFKFVVDHERDDEMQCIFHILILNKLVKFYRVETELESHLDRSMVKHVWSIVEGLTEEPYNWELRE